MKKAAASTWPGASVVPTMGTGATDSRHLRSVGIQAYGVSVSPATRAEALAGRLAHGPDERRPARWLESGARFLHDLTFELAQPAP
jgi:acetylornithine deacetylase/succinyl-diaminopimelate desuccinylase-like protein